jgi:hypothetical protein
MKMTKMLVRKKKKMKARNLTRNLLRREREHRRRGSSRQLSRLYWRKKRSKGRVQQEGRRLISTYTRVSARMERLVLGRKG